MKIVRHSSDIFLVLLLMMTVAILPLLASGCSSTGEFPIIRSSTTQEPINSSQSDATSDDTANQEEYVGIYALGSVDYFIDHKIGLIRAGEELGVNAVYTGPADDNIDEMIQCFEDAIDRKVKGIVVFGMDDRLAPSINKAWDNGIPTVTVDGDVKNSRRIAFVGTGNYSAGQLGGEKLIEMLSGQGQVAILTEPNVELHRDRTRGYVEALKTAPGIEVVEVADTKASHDDAYSAAISLLNRYPDLKALACTDYFGGIAASIAVEELGRKGRVKILSMDRSNFVLKKIDEGVITATLVQQTALMSYYAMMVLYHFNHNPVPIAANAQEYGVTGVPVYIDTGVFVIDQTNFKPFIRN